MLLVLPLIFISYLSPSAHSARGFIFYQTFLLSCEILTLLLNKSLIPALLLQNCVLFNLFNVSISVLLSLSAWILQEGRLLPDNAKAPGGENSQGWALSVQSGFSAWGATEKVLDYKLDGDAALLLLRPFIFGPWSTRYHAGLTRAEQRTLGLPSLMDNWSSAGTGCG